MKHARRFWLLVLTLVMSVSLTACGYTGTTQPINLSTSNMEADTSAQDFTQDEAKTASELNASGVLDTKDITEFESVLGRTATVLNPPKANAKVQAVGVDSVLEGGGGFFSVKRLTKIGYIRSIESDKYLLLLKGETTKLSVVGQDGKRDARIANYLNRKVVLRGIMMANGSLMVEHILSIPSFKFVTDLFLRGRLAGTVYLPVNNQGLVGALVVAKAARTGYLFRTQTNKRGEFFFSGLDPDTYSVTVGLGGFKGVTQEGVVILKGKKTSLMLGMSAN